MKKLPTVGQSPPPPPNENIGGQTYRFAPPPTASNFANLKKFIISNARMGWKSTVIHYKTIEFNINIILNINNSQFFGALRAQLL